MSEIAKPIVWAQTQAIRKPGTINFNLLKWNALLFGECGAGKSTALSLIARIYAQLYPIASRNEMLKFEHLKSIKSVTTQVTKGNQGNMVLVDTPGTNDPNKLRSD